MDCPAHPSPEPERYAAPAEGLIVPVPSPHAPPPSDDAKLWTRVRGLVGALQIVEGAAPAHDRLVALRGACAELACAFEAPGRLPLAADREALDRVVERAEQELLAVDDEVVPGALRAHLDAWPPPPQALGGYAAVLAASLGDDIGRRNRLELLVTRLLTEDCEPGGRVVVETCDETRELLLRVTGGRQLSDDARRTALEVLADHRRRVEALASPEALFESGLYANLYAYKLALHGLILDFNVLYAVAGLNAAISNLFRAHEVPVDGALQARFRAARRGVQRTIQAACRVEPAPQAARFEPTPLLDPLAEVRVVSASGRSRSIITPDFTPLRNDGSLAKRVLTVLLLAMLPFAAGSMRASPGFGPLSDAEVQQLAPWVGRASLSAGGKALAATVEPATWNALDRASRQEKAEALARALAERDTNAAILSSAGRMVIQIEKAQVVYVQ